MWRQGQQPLRLWRWTPLSDRVQWHSMFLGTLKVISMLPPTCDTVDSWDLLMLPHLGIEPTTTWPHDPMTQSHYPDTEQTIPFHILAIPNTMLGCDNDPFCKVLALIGCVSTTWPPALEANQSSNRSSTHNLLLRCLHFFTFRLLIWNAYYYSDVTTLLSDITKIVTWLLEFYVLATSKVVSGWTLTCDSAQ